jgi:hypothetical protein
LTGSFLAKLGIGSLFFYSFNLTFTNLCLWMFSAF